MGKTTRPPHAKTFWDNDISVFYFFFALHVGPSWKSTIWIVIAIQTFKFRMYHVCKNNSRIKWLHYHQRIFRSTVRGGSYGFNIKL